MISRVRSTTWRRSQIFGAVVILVVVILAFYAWSSHYFSAALHSLDEGLRLRNFEEYEAAGDTKPAADKAVPWRQMMYGGSGAHPVLPSDHKPLDSLPKLSDKVDGLPKHSGKTPLLCDVVYTDASSLSGVREAVFNYTQINVPGEKPVDDYVFLEDWKVLPSIPKLRTMFHRPCAWYMLHNEDVWTNGYAVRAAVSGLNSRVPYLMSREVHLYQMPDASVSNKTVSSALSVGLLLSDGMVKLLASRILLAERLDELIGDVNIVRQMAYRQEYVCVPLGFNDIRLVQCAQDAGVEVSGFGSDDYSFGKLMPYECGEAIDTVLATALTIRAVGVEQPCWLNALSALHHSKAAPDSLRGSWRTHTDECIRHAEGAERSSRVQDVSLSSLQFAIIVGVATSDQVDAILESWGSTDALSTLKSGIPSMHFFSEAKMEDVVKVSTQNMSHVQFVRLGSASTGYRKAQLKAPMSLEYLVDYDLRSDWVIGFDSDTAFNLPALRAQLRYYNASEPVLLGQLYRFWWDFPAGGAGIVLSWPAVELIVAARRALPKPLYDCAVQKRQLDVWIGRCAQRVGIRMYNLRGLSQHPCLPPSMYPHGILSRVPMIGCHRAAGRRGLPRFARKDKLMQHKQYVDWFDKESRRQQRRLRLRCAIEEKA